MLIDDIEVRKANLLRGQMQPSDQLGEPWFIQFEDAVSILIFKIQVIHLTSCNFDNVCLSNFADAYFAIIDLFHNNYSLVSRIQSINLYYDQWTGFYTCEILPWERLKANAIIWFFKSLLVDVFTEVAEVRAEAFTVKSWGI